MGKFAKAAKTVEKKARKIGAKAQIWWIDHQETVLDVADFAFQMGVAYLAGVGIGNIILDGSGIRNAIHKADIAEAEKRGYDNGFVDGGRFTSEMIGIAQGSGKTPELPTK